MRSPKPAEIPSQNAGNVDGPSKNVSNHSTVPSFSLRSSLACLLCTGALHSAEARPSEETAAWIQAVTHACGGSWSPRDIAAVDTLVRAVHSDPILEAAQRARILLVAPFRGPNAASRRACLYHPQGAAVTMLGTLADAAYAQDGLHGDGRSYADTLFDGAGLSSDDLSILLHGRSFETLNSDATCYLLSGTGTRINGETGIMHQDWSSQFIMGSTHHLALGGELRGRAVPSGAIGFVSQKLADPQYRYYADDRLMSSGPYPERRQHGLTGQETFKLLSDGGKRASTAVIHTLVIAPALPPSGFAHLRSAVAAANEDRMIYAGVPVVTSPRRIWIFAGQSNCAGDQVNVANPSNRSVFPIDEPHPNVLQWMRSGAQAGTAEAATHPLDFDGGGAPVGVGPAMAFAKRLLEQDPQQQILIIPAAVGATGFSSKHWNPGDPVYERMVSMVNAALPHGGTIAGMVWNQGEGDTELDATAYAVAWETMFRDFSTRIPGGWPEPAVVVYGDLAKGTFSNVTNAIEKTLVPAGKQRVFVTKKMAGIDTLTEEEVFDDASKIHYSARSQRLLGRAYAEAVISLRAKP